MKPKRVILCPNPYRDSELKVCRQSRDMLESLGMQTSVCLPFQREGYGEELGLSMRPLQQEIRQADLLILRGHEYMRCPERSSRRAMQVRDLEMLIERERVDIPFGPSARQFNLSRGWCLGGRTMASLGINLDTPPSKK